MQFLHGLGAFRQPPASRSRHPEAASEHPIAASGHPRAFRRHPSNVAENVTKIGVPENCASHPRREAYFFKNRALTTGASTTFHIEVIHKLGVAPYALNARLLQTIIEVLSSWYRGVIEAGIEAEIEAVQNVFCFCLFLTMSREVSNRPKCDLPDRNDF